MIRTTKLLRTSQALLLAIVVPLFTLASCDGFLVSVCNFEHRPACETAASELGSPTSPTDGSGGPVVGSEREFNHKLDISLASSRFVGMNEKNPITLATNNLRFETFSINLDAGSLGSSPGCLNCPQIPSGFSYAEDRIYKAGNQFFFFQYNGMVEHLYRIYGNSKVEIVTVLLNDNEIVRPFSHPDLNFMMFSSKSTDINYKYNTATLDDGVPIASSAGRGNAEPTMYVIGDLDSNEPKPNGLEFITFGGGDAMDLFHFQRTDYLKDPLLLIALANSVRSTKNGDETKLLGAYITNLNNDRHPDFIYARSGKIFVTSYLGSSGGVPQFKNWTDPVVTITGKTIKSITAIDMNQDTFPDLIIETDQDLQFFASNPKL